MKELNYEDVIQITTNKLSHGGIFLTVAGETPNTMTIGWGSIGFYWGKPCITAIVRPQRHTHPLLMAANEFTVSVPLHDMADELKYAGVVSGKTENKLDGRNGLTTAPAQEVSAPIIKECELHFECKVKLIQDMTGDQMDETVMKRMYPGGDFHTMFFGEIVRCYTTAE